MPPIRTGQVNPAHNVALTELYIPTDSDIGTGTFTTVLAPNALLEGHTEIVSIVSNPGIFQISVTIHADNMVAVLLSRSDGSPPVHRLPFRLPEWVDPLISHALLVRFAGWYIIGATFDGQPISSI